ncbi:LysR family transcriptional regulator [Sedimenticola sp.]|uniref:LysR family transcriptional regulator n=1 Tax=Sedimenticola sp. TaxID=1940285 RepID=UPI00258A3B5B|nr:LysR family transcriptional regulator [Sedimenticola sp.]MCW8905557.1 LysR family transcriptional regulator [Sedimenticola sp.]
MDKLQAMAVFVKIAEQGSLTAAANAMGKSLPSVVRMLASLEESLQVRLFNRTTRRIALTEEGLFYLERCRKILAEIEESEVALCQDQVEPHGTITLTAPVRFGEMHVAPSVTRFLSQYQGVQVNLLLLDRVVNLVDEGIDLAVRIAHLGDSSLIAKPVGEIRQVVCATPTLLAASGGAPRRPEQLSDLPCVHCTSISSSPLWHFSDSGKRLDVKISGAFMCNQVGASVDACVAGLGFGLFFNYQVMPWVKRGELETVLRKFEPAPLPLSLVYPHTRLMARRVRTLVDWLERDLKHSFAR